MPHFFNEKLHSGNNKFVPFHYSYQLATNMWLTIIYNRISESKLTKHHMLLEEYKISNDNITWLVIKGISRVKCHLSLNVSTSIYKFLIRHYQYQISTKWLCRCYIIGKIITINNIS